MEQQKAASHAVTAILKAVGDTIKETSPTPAGTLYAAMMAKGISFQAYEKIIGAFIATGKVRQKNNLLYWIG